MAVLVVLAGLMSFEARGADLPKENKGFVTKCFKDYLDLKDQEVGALARRKPVIRKSIARLKKKCLTKEFRSKLKKLGAKGQDPIFLAHDPKPSWKLDARVDSFDAAKSEAQVILGSGEEEHCLKVHLKTPALNQIDSIKTCP